MSATEQTLREGPPADYGELVFHAANSVHGVRKRTVRWVSLVSGALVLSAVVVLYVLGTFGRSSGAPPWWIYVPLLSSWLLLLWGFSEFLGLLTAWRHVGWAVDVYQHGVVESRFGTVRQAMPYTGGVLTPRRALFTSPRPDVGSGRLTAPWRGELRQAPSEIRAAARRVLVRETLARLRAGHSVGFPGERDGKPGITLTPSLLRLPDGREYAYSSMRIRYHFADGSGGYGITGDPARADGAQVLTDDENESFRTEGGNGVPGLRRRSPNLAVVREALHVLIDPDGHRTMYRAQLSAQEQEQP